MLSPATIREWQIDQLRKAPTVAAYIVQATPAADLTTYRDGGDGWTALEALGHLWDYEPVMYERARVTLEQDSPDLPGGDQEAMAREKRYNDQSPVQLAREWAQRRQPLVTLFEGVAEDQWSRPARHPRRGLMTLSDLLALVAWHDTNHLEQMTRTLAEKRAP